MPQYLGLGLMPAAPSYYSPEYSNRTIRDLIQRQGASRAQGAAASGDIWANAVSQLGQQLGGYFQQRQEQNELKKRDQATLNLVRDWDGQDEAALFGGLTKIGGPEYAKQYAPTIVTLKSKPHADPEKELEAFGKATRVLLGQKDEVIAEGWPLIVQRFGETANRAGISLPDQWSPEYRPVGEKIGEVFGGAKPEKAEPLKLGATERLIDPNTNQVLVGAEEKPPDAPKTVNVGGRVKAFDPETGGYTKDLGASEAALARAARAAEAGGAKRGDDGDIIADAWAQGMAFPTTQEATTAALQSFKRRGLPVPRKLGIAQQQEATGAAMTLQTLEDVEQAYQAVKGKVGPFSYRMAELAQKIPGIQADPDFETFNALLRGMGNLEIKRITGAQMSEKEADRLLKGMATGTLKPAEFEAALNVMRKNAKRSRDILLYGHVQKDGGGRNDGGGPQAGERRTINGRLAEWDGKGWLAVQ